MIASNIWFVDECVNDILGLLATQQFIHGCISELMREMTFNVICNINFSMFVLSTWATAMLI